MMEPKVSRVEQLLQTTYTALNQIQQYEHGNSSPSHLQVCAEKLEDAINQLQQIPQGTKITEEGAQKLAAISQLLKTVSPHVLGAAGAVLRGDELTRKLQSLASTLDNLRTLKDQGYKVQPVNKTSSGKKKKQQ